VKQRFASEVKNRDCTPRPYRVLFAHWLDCSGAARISFCLFFFSRPPNRSACDRGYANDAASRPNLSSGCTPFCQTCSQIETADVSLANDFADDVLCPPTFSSPSPSLFHSPSPSPVLFPSHVPSPSPSLFVSPSPSRAPFFPSPAPFPFLVHASSPFSHLFLFLSCLSFCPSSSCDSDLNTTCCD